MKNVLLATLVTLFSLGTQAAPQEIAGVRFEEQSQLGGQNLSLNGAGLRTRFFFKIYAIGLYLPRKASSLEALLADKGPRQAQITTLRELTAEQFSDALIEGLKKNHSAAELEKLSARIDNLQATMQALAKLPEKTQIRLDYLPASGTRLLVGGVQKGGDIPGEDFNAALLRIWLGNEPAQEDLRSQLLGK